MATPLPYNQLGGFSGNDPRQPLFAPDGTYIGPPGGMMTTGEAGLNQNAPTAPDWWSQNVPGVGQAPPIDPDARNANPNMPTAPGQVGADWQAWFMNLVQGKPWNQQTLLDLAPQLQAAGIQLTPPNATGDQTKIGIPGPNGTTQWVRVGFGEGHPVWIPQGDGSAAGTGSASPFGNLGGAGNMSPSDWMKQDPGYQFQLDQGLKALQRGAAAKGTLLTGGTGAGLERYAEDYANNAYSGVFNRNYQLAALGKPS